MIGDIHGCYKLLRKLLEEANYNSERDRLIFIGDYIDRGPDSLQVLELIMELVSRGAIALLGNHEEMLLSAYSKPERMIPWLMNGGSATLASFGINNRSEAGIKEIPLRFITFLENLPLYHETDDYVFVHAGLDPTMQNPKETNKYALLWIREEWLSCKYRGKKVIFGHTPTFLIHPHREAEPWIDDDKICIDTGAVYSQYGGKLSCLELPNMKVYNCF